MLSEFCSSSLQCLVCHKHNMPVQVYAELLLKDAKSMQRPGSGNFVPKAP